jgi:hypothetical protein
MYKERSMFNFQMDTLFQDVLVAGAVVIGYDRIVRPWLDKKKIQNQGSGQVPAYSAGGAGAAEALPKKTEKNVLVTLENGAQIMVPGTSPIVTLPKSPAQEARPPRTFKTVVEKSERPIRMYKTTQDEGEVRDE